MKKHQTYQIDQFFLNMLKEFDDLDFIGMILFARVCRGLREDVNRIL